jgi:N-acetylglutamate synthase-like GNAT family acetyltransferase
MVFWKSLFSGTESISKKSSGTKNKVAKAIGNAPIPIQTIGIRPPGSNPIVLSLSRDLDLYELEELCDAVGWARRPLRKVRKALQNSFLVVSMWEIRGNTQRMIGFARATSDGAFNATIWDVVIHPDFQGKSMGKAIMKYMIKKIRSEDISNITLFADPHVVGFYDGMGFVEDPEGIKGMFWYPD